ncbi:MAG TPA: LysE family translocator [Gammaproteobacteria bacterium]|nr:LysE family translocator [Gammaproteobacteria bacterium]
MQYAHLGAFFLLVFGIVLLPGLDMAFVLGTTLTGGRRTGLTAVSGIVVGGICHVTMATLGISVLLRTFPGAFNGLLLAGALYIAWIGISILRSRTGFGSTMSGETLSSVVAFRRGLTTSLLNPKAYLFMLAVFPQFLRPEYGVIWLQAAVLWIIIAATQISVYGGVAVAAGQARQWLAGNSVAMTYIGRTVGVLLLIAALCAAVDGWRGL